MYGNQAQPISSSDSRTRQTEAARMDAGTWAATRTTVMERVLLMAIIITLPLQDSIPAMAGMSFSYILFGVAFLHLVLNRPQVFWKTWMHPVFLALYLLIYVGIVVETLHPYVNFKVVRRIAEMTAGAVLVASICRDRKALQAGINAFLIAGIGLSVFLFLTSYGALRGASAADFREASNVRAEVFDDMALNANLNRMALVASQGTVVALAFAMAAKKPRQRLLFMGLCGFCTVAAFLPVSRSGVLTVALASAVVLFAYRGRGRWMRMLVTGVLLAGAIVFFVPDVVFSRMAYSTESKKGKQEGRARVYTNSFAYLDEYLFTGVGAGNFATSWGQKHGYVSRGGNTLGAHNTLLQVTIFWGLAGLFALCLIVWQAYRCVPKFCGDDVLAISLKGLAVTVLMLMLVVHALYAKEYSLGLGMLVGAQRWVWPSEHHKALMRHA